MRPLLRDRYTLGFGRKTLFLQAEVTVLAGQTVSFKVSVEHDRERE